MPRKAQLHHLRSIPKEKVVKLYREAVVADVPLETLQQKITTFLLRTQTTLHLEELEDKQRNSRIKKQMPLLSRLFFHVVPALCIFIGLFLVGNAAVPILSYYVLGSELQADGSLLAPIPKDQVLDSFPGMVGKVRANVDGTSLEDQFTIQPTVIEEDLDYTNLSNWFSNQPVPEGFTQELVQEETSIEYRLDIPSIHIENARIRVGGTNLDRSLIQYPGTALPGEHGAPVIFGHSVLRQFYNPSVTNPRRYISIFSTIRTLKPGDKIYVTYNNARYTYVVKEKRDVKPEDTFILQQNYDVKELKLITCAPEGTYWLRGVITAELESTE